MIGWLFNLVYLALAITVSPVLMWRAATQGKYRTGWRQKLLGRLPQSHERECVVWLHAVSVGEVLQLRTFVAQLRQRQPHLTVFISTTTHTGNALARETFPGCRIGYLPLDFTWAVKVALRRVRPAVIGLVELELWPNLIRQAAAAGIPLMLINGRMSARSHRGYRRLRPLMRRLLRCFDRLAVQTDEYARRLIDLGAPPERMRVTGSVKFDGVQVEHGSRMTAALRKVFRINPSDAVLMAGSTHAPEEAILLDAWLRLRQEFPHLKLVLVPRHQERFEEVAALVTSRNRPLLRRSHGGATSEKRPAAVPEDAVRLLDTLGELTACWGLADVAFVGGSLTRRGGQNMIEPAAYGIPVIVGPNTANFRDVVEGLGSVEGIVVVPGAAELEAAIREVLGDPAAAHRRGRAARDFVRSQQGATQRTVTLLEQILAPSPRQKSSRAA